MRRGDVESFLEVLVEDIEESVGEPPHEEEDGDERDLSSQSCLYGAFKVDLQE